MPSPFADHLAAITAILEQAERRHLTHVEVEVPGLVLRCSRLDEAGGGGPSPLADIDQELAELGIRVSK